MEIDRNGNLILSCPNYAQDDMTGCIVRINRDKEVEKWFDVPVHPETKLARNMGIAFDRDWNLYICDNQGLSLIHISPNNRSVRRRLHLRTVVW